MRGKGLLVWTLAVATVAPLAGAQEHLVAPAAVKQELAAAVQQREQDRATVSALVASPVAAPALARVGVRPDEVTRRLGSLSNDELASLAARARALDADPRAGDVIISLNEVLILVLIVAIVVLVINAAK